MALGLQLLTHVPGLLGKNDRRLGVMDLLASLLLWSVRFVIEVSVESHIRFQLRRVVHVRVRVRAVVIGLVVWSKV
jgi:hypothetical protein